MGRPLISLQVGKAASLLRPEGVYLAELIEAFGLSQPRVSRIMLVAESEGKAFSLRIGLHSKFFPTLADYNAAKAERDAAAAERERERLKRRAASRDRSASAEAARVAKLARAEARAIRAAEAEIAKQRARQQREAKLAELQRQRAEAKSQQARLRAETKALGLLAKLRGTTTTAPVKRTGPAHIAGELDLSKLKTCDIRPPMRDRFAPDPGFVGAFSSLKPGQYLEAA